MNMSISRKDGALLIGVLGVLIAVLTYVYVYMPYSEKAAALESSNAVLKSRVDILQQLANNKEDMEKKTKINNQETESILDHFPVDVLEEDMIMLAVQLEEEAPFEEISSIAISTPAQVYVSADVNPLVEAKVQALLGTTAPVATTQEQPADAAQPAEPVQPAVPQTYTLYNRTGNISCTTSYTGLKNAVNYLVTRYDKSDLELSATYDMATGLLSADITVISSYLPGTGKLYAAPSTPFVPKGTSNIFGTIEIPAGNQE